jgi:dihydropyrimidinase
VVDQVAAAVKHAEALVALVGADADIAICDPRRAVTISHDLLQDGSDYTPYEGFRVTGWPVLTMVRGRTVVRDGELVGRKAFGQYLARQKSSLAQVGIRAEISMGG